MKILVIYGQNHKGNTYALTQLFVQALGRHGSGCEVREIYPKDGPQAYCTGCMNCFYNGEQACPHADEVAPIVAAIEQADVLIIASACYVLGMTAWLKNLLDHMGYCFMTHRPRAPLFGKRAIVLSTAAGAGMKETNKAISQNLLFWGIPQINRYGLRIGAANFESIGPRRMKGIRKSIAKIARRTVAASGKRPGWKTRFLFEMMRKMQHGNDWNALDRQYWMDRDWLADEKPF